jgi:hypothetical protein
MNIAIMSLKIDWIQNLPSVFNESDFIARPTVAVDVAGNSYVAYVSINPSISWPDQTSVGLVDVCVIKFDPSGNVIWYRQQPSFDTTNNDIDPSICLDSDSNVYVAYSTMGTTSGQSKTGLSDIAIFAISNDGQILWVRQTPEFNTSGNDTVPKISCDMSGNLYVSYYAVNPLTFADRIILFKMTTTGTFLWIKGENAPFNTEGSNFYPAISVDSSGNCYVAYWCEGSPPASGETSVGDYDIVVFKTDTNGNLLWIRQRPSFNTTQKDEYPSITVDSQGNCYVAYYTIQGVASGQTNDNNSIDIVVFKMDTDGNTLWVSQNATFNTANADLFPSIAVDGRGYIYLSYMTTGVASGQTTTGETDIVIVQMNSFGKTTEVLQQPTFNTIYENTLPTIAVDEQGNCYVVYYSVNEIQQTQNLVVFKLSNLICVVGETQILLIDGQTKAIKDIQRGDWVAPNHQVARVCREPIDIRSRIDLVVFEPYSLGSYPHTRLVVTPNHPIFYRGARRPAKCFARCIGVTMIQQKQVGSLVHLMGENALYDLQFDHEGSYYANGVEIQSRSPFSCFSPLPRELYFDLSLYTNERVWDSLDQDLPLDTTQINFNVVVLRNKKHHKGLIDHLNHAVIKYPK